MHGSPKCFSCGRTATRFDPHLQQWICEGNSDCSISKSPSLIPPRTPVVAAVISRGDRLLICQRPLHKRHGGLWEFPGGKCESDESIATTIRRELQEELSVQVIEVGHKEFEIADPGSSFLIKFVRVRISGEPLCNEHISLKWAKLSELEALPLAPSDRRYLEFRYVTGPKKKH